MQLFFLTKGLKKSYDFTGTIFAACVNSYFVHCVRCAVQQGPHFLWPPCASQLMESSLLTWRCTIPTTPVQDPFSRPPYPSPSTTSYLHVRNILCAQQTCPMEPVRTSTKQTLFCFPILAMHVRFLSLFLSGGGGGSDPPRARPQKGAVCHAAIGLRVCGKCVSFVSRVCTVSWCKDFYVSIVM